MRMLKKLSQLTLSNQSYQLSEERKKALSKILDTILPEPYNHETERVWVNRIRISLMNKRNQLSDLDNEEIKKIISKLNDLGLEPTFSVPWELKDGVPKLRKAETLLFSKGDDEFFLLEKGFFTYFKDIVHENVNIRTFFESYSPYVLKKLLNQTNLFKIDEYISDWIQFSRILLKSAIKIIDGIDIDQYDLLS
ncbi:MAG: hypothetical protein GF353_10280, partial [Candidatus Lokiarchaeota archaeon]|nr:hypothetical protein [Candidatus Lokiarchaeota archaeon]